MRELHAYVWRSSASRQIVLIILAIIAAVLATAPLELQRHIMNTLAGHEKFERLGWLCGGYLIAALAIGGLKYIVNIRTAGLGEFMIRSLREEVLRNSSSSPNPDATPDETTKHKSGALVTTISGGLHHPTAGRGRSRITPCPLFREKVTPTLSGWRVQK